ncbi:MAG: SPOR domain-containing protein [Persephonella sp.]|nr:SPOR domain-containing protein [Persephonella sp.]
MKKRYLITALITGVALTNVSTLNYFAISASASSQGYYTERSKKTKKSEPESPEKVLPDVYRVRMLIAQDTATRKEKVFKTEKEKFFSLQLGSFKKKENAERFLKKLPEELRDGAFIYRTDRGFYTVRYGLFDNYNLLKEIQNKLPISSVIVKTDITKVAKEKQFVLEEKLEEKRLQKKLKRQRRKEKEQLLKKKRLCQNLKRKR